MQDPNPNAVVPAPQAQVAPVNFGSAKVDADDFIPPRVKIVQAQSDERDMGVDEGNFFNTLTSEDYGPQVNFIPIGIFKNRVLLVRDERIKAINKALKTAGVPEIPADSSGLTCRSLDMETGRGVPGIGCAECPLSQWTQDGGNNTPPLCSETYNVTAINDAGDLIILSFSKSSAKVGKRMFSMVRLGAGAPWRSMYEATTLKEKGQAGSYFVPVVRKVGEAPPELMRLAQAFQQQLEGVVIDITPEAAEATETEPPVDGDAPWEGAES